MSILNQSLINWPVDYQSPTLSFPLALLQNVTSTDNFTSTLTVTEAEPSTTITPVMTTNSPPTTIETTIATTNEPTEVNHDSSWFETWLVFLFILPIFVIISSIGYCYFHNKSSLDDGSLAEKEDVEGPKSNQQSDKTLSSDSAPITSISTKSSIKRLSSSHFDGKHEDKVLFKSITGLSGVLIPKDLTTMHKKSNI